MLNIFKQKSSSLGPNKAKREDIKALYRSIPSFVDLLPWVEYLSEPKQYLFNDGVSRMSVIKIDPIATEGRDQHSLDEISRDLANVISDSFPAYDNDPWTMQIFLNNEPVLDEHVRAVESAMDEHGDTKYTSQYLKTYKEHIARVTRKGGMFFDKEVTGSVWGGTSLNIRVCIYRRYWKSKPTVDTEYELTEIMDKFYTGLSAIGLGYQNVDGAEFYRWMAMWFNPAPSQFDHDKKKMIEQIPYPEEEDSFMGRDLAEMVLFNAPSAHMKKGYWKFDDRPHTVIQVGNLTRKPLHGALSGEITHSEKTYAFTDKLPPDSVVSMTMFVLAQDSITNKINTIAARAIGDTAESELTRGVARKVLLKQNEDPLFPIEVGIYVSGGDEVELGKNVAKVRSLMNHAGLQTIDPKADPISLDNYIKNLPGVPVEAADRISRQRARLAFSTNIASLAPMYGRSRGTGNPGLLFWNRSGEPLTIDPLNKNDRRKNAHLLFLGPTGAGKSASLVGILQSMIAIHRPRIFIIETGNSFGLFADHAMEQGLSVNKIKLSHNSAVALAPFSEVVKLVTSDTSVIDTEIVASDGVISSDILEDVSAKANADDEDEDEDAERDILGEAELLAVLMITGGEDKERERLTRSNRMTIRTAIVNAAVEVSSRESGNNKVVLPQDIAQSLLSISQEPEYADSAKEIREMGDSMMMFCDGLNGHLFNQVGTSWPEVDVTVIDLYEAAKEGNEDTLAVAYISLIQRINGLVERDQMKGRETIVLTDEAHLITTNALLMPYVVSITKMWRKLGAWYWLATQNVEDFPDSARKLLNMIEWWICLTMPVDEIDQISRFKRLTDEQRAMMESASKGPGQYTEGVLLCSIAKTLIRIVPPALSLALAQTEKHEKAMRQQLMDKFGCTEIQAAYIVSEQMKGIDDVEVAAKIVLGSSKEVKHEIA